MSKTSAGTLVKKDGNSDRLEHAALLARLDGWANILTGLGMKGKDKRLGADFVYELWDRASAEQLYGSDDMASKIVDIPVDEMLREGFEFEWEGSPDNLQDLLMEEHERLNGPCCFEEGMKWARSYGGSGIVLGVNDGQTPDKPINYGNIKSIDFANTLTKWELHAESTDIQQDPTKPYFGLPQVYRMQPQESGGFSSNILIHASRVIRFDGVKLPRHLFIQNNYWGDTVFNRCFNAIRNFHLVHDSLAALLQDFAQAVYKIKNLTEMIAMGKDDLVMKRLQLMDSLRSIVRAIVVEEGEEFGRETTTMTGIPDVVKLVNERLVHCSKIPHTVLLGESPGGSLGGTGQSEKRDWYDQVAAEQCRWLKPAYLQWFELIMMAKKGPTKGVVPKSWSIKFIPLWKPTPKEEAETYKTTAEADAIYLDRGVLDPNEVATSRFTGKDSPIQIDESLRRELPSLQQPDQNPNKQAGGGQEENSNQDEILDDLMATRKDIISHEGEWWVIYNHTKTKVLGRYKSEGEARKRLAEIEHFKNKK